MSGQDLTRLYDAQAWTRLRMHPNPLRMAFSPGVWSSAWYLFSYLVVSTVLFSVVLTMTVTSACVAIIWLGLPLLIGTAYFIRGCVVMERGRARAVVPEGLPALEPMNTGDGFFGTLKAVWKDGLTQRGLVHFILLYVPLFALATGVFAIWLGFLAMITVPIWYRYIPFDFDGQTVHGMSWGYFPHGPHGKDAVGFFIGSDLSASVAAVVSLVLFLAWNYVLVAAARVHAVALRVVITGRDPLGPARRILESPGPLSSAAYVSADAKPTEHSSEAA
ncbi:MAG: sensor domain-containing protein [Catenulispora sp.]|nr:sensor domain-containing protein [Catenulispora sp.]